MFFWYSSGLHTAGKSNCKEKSFVVVWSGSVLFPRKKWQKSRNFCNGFSWVVHLHCHSKSPHIPVTRGLSRLAGGQTGGHTAAQLLLMETLGTTCCCLLSSRAANQNILSKCFPAGLTCWNFNTCQLLSSLEQQLNMSPALSSTCSQLSP